MPGIRLALVTLEREAEFGAFLDEWRNEAFDPFARMFAIAWTDYAGYVALVHELRDGRGPVAGLVPSETSFVEEDGRILGIVNRRYALNEALERFGGHIGYAVRPSARGRGVAKAALRLALADLRAHGIAEALLTCGDWNTISARVIESCGGRRIGDAEADGVIERRYLVPTG
jgi:predicted acetyltransferase